MHEDLHPGRQGCGQTWSEPYTYGFHGPPGGESELRESSNGVLWASGSVGTEFHTRGLRILWRGEERRGKEKGAVRKVASPLWKATGKVAAVPPVGSVPEGPALPSTVSPTQPESLNRLEGVIPGL